MTDKDFLDVIINNIKSFVPSYRIKSKADSKFMSFLGWLLGLINNPSFMMHTWTTVGYTTYLPINPPPDQWIEVAHEGQHVRQALKWTRPLMGLLYLAPIPKIALLIVLGSILSVIGHVHWGLAAFALAALCLAPLPAYFRKLFEFDAYIVTIACYYWRYGAEAMQTYMPYVIGYFTGPEYYFMWPFETSLAKQFNQVYADVVNGSILNNNPYLTNIYNDLKANGMLNKDIP